MHSTKAFGWVLLALVVLLSAGVYKGWREGRASRAQVAVAVVSVLLIVATVANVWASY